MKGDGNMDGNNLFTLGLDISATKALIEQQLKSIVQDISNAQSLKVVVSLDAAESQKKIQSQLNAINQQLKGNIQKNAVDIPIRVDLSNARKYDETLKEITNDTKKVADSTNLSKMSQQFQMIDKQAHKVKTSTGSMFVDLKSQFKSTFSNFMRYQLAYEIVNNTKRAISTLVKSVTELDAVLVEFNKVADLSENQLIGFTERAYEVSSEIGRTGKDMIEASTEFKRAGYDIERSLEMGKAALVTTNIAEGIDTTSEAASTLISVLKGFNMSETDIMSIADKMNSVSNQSPVGFDNLANGLERISGTMYQSGNTIDETIGLLTGGFAQLRNMEKVSTGLITISQRLRAVDEDGAVIEGLSSELNEEFGKIGVSIEDSNGNLRSTYDILSDYAKVYDTLSNKQKQYYAELASGKRQVTVFNAIIQQMKDVENAVDQSINSVGSAEKENEIYRQSIEGLKNEFNNAIQELATEVISSDWIKELISGATMLLKTFTNIAAQDELISGTIGVITKTFKGLATVLKEISDNDFVGHLVKGFLMFKTIDTGVGIFKFFKDMKTSKKYMNAFFQSAVDGTMQMKNGIVQIGKAERNTAKSGIWNAILGRDQKNIQSGEIFKWVYPLKVA